MNLLSRVRLAAPLRRRLRSRVQWASIASLVFAAGCASLFARSVGNPGEVTKSNEGWQIRDMLVPVEGSQLLSVHAQAKPDDTVELSLTLNAERPGLDCEQGVVVGSGDSKVEFAHVLTMKQPQMRATTASASRSALTPLASTTGARVSWCGLDIDLPEQQTAILREFAQRTTGTKG